MAYACLRLYAETPRVEVDRRNDMILVRMGPSPDGLAFGLAFDEAERLVADLRAALAPVEAQA